ncbi:MAG: hypothetical protein KAI64_05860, partial [Thermoplasmata archaeon]|nr:hypothetical protein [Thermoplasmata archaeon]
MITISAHGASRKNPIRGNALGNSTDACSRNTSARGDSLKRLSDNDLLERLDRLRGNERAVQFEILKYLSEVDRRRLYLPRGYHSLFEFCTGYLKYSNSSAGRRIRAARCIEQFPRVGRMFLAGELDLTVIARIAHVLTKENADEVLAWIKGKPFRDVEIFASRNRPGRFLRDSVRPIFFMTEHQGAGSSAHTASGAENRAGVRCAPPDEECKASFTFTSNVGSESMQHVVNKSDKNQVFRAASDGDARGIAASTGESTAPAAEQVNRGARPSAGDETVEHVVITEKFKLEFAVDPEFMENLSSVKSLLSTKYPKGMDFQTVFGILMQEYLERHSPEERIKRRTVRTERASRGENRSEPGRQRCSKSKTACREKESSRTSAGRGAGAAPAGERVSGSKNKCNTHGPEKRSRNI